MCLLADVALLLLVVTIAAVLAWGLAGCSHHVLPASSTNTVDSIRVERVEVIRWDTVMVPVPVERVEVMAPADTTSTLTTSLAISMAGLRNGMLWHTIENRHDSPITAAVPVKDTEISTGKVLREVIREPYPVEMPLTWWQRLRMNLGGWLMGVVALGGGWWIVKTFLFRK